MARRSAAEAAAWLMTPAAVRARAHDLLQLAERDALEHFRLVPERLAGAVDLVVDTISLAYPDLDIPFHSRWRHFGVGGRDRWGEVRQALGPGEPADEIARTAFDLAVTSVLLDAGAGAAWRFREADGRVYARSEGLAVASVALFRHGSFSGTPGRRLRADATGLSQVTDERLAAGMQVTADNSLVGLPGRAALLRRLGDRLAEEPALFGRDARIGNLFDHLRGRAVAGRLQAAAVLEAVLRGFGPIWPGRHALAGVNLGDTWRHRAFAGDDAAADLVPFHKLSQWLAYSLIEPLEAAGVSVTDIDALTGLAEYRNGGLVVDTGVLVPRDPTLAERPLQAGDEAVVEWRCLTIALLDRIAEGVRRRLGLDAARLPLAKVLEGGTWAAGRRIAAEKRPGGGPPLAIVSDGTVF